MYEEHLLIVVPDVPEVGAPGPHELLEVGRYNARAHQAHPPCSTTPDTLPISMVSDPHSFHADLDPDPGLDFEKIKEFYVKNEEKNFGSGSQCVSGSKDSNRNPDSNFTSLIPELHWN